MKRMLTVLAACAAVSMLCGCASLGEFLDSDAAASVASIAPDDYAKAFEQIQKIIGKKKNRSPLEGFTYKLVYRYRGTICEASDITWEHIYTQVGSAAQDTPPASVVVTNGAGPSVDADVDEIADILEDLGIGGI